MEDKTEQEIMEVRVDMITSAFDEIIRHMNDEYPMLFDGHKVIWEFEIVPSDEESRIN